MKNDSLVPRENLIRAKSFDFAIRIINLRKTLHKEREEYVMSKQLLRSGTSIGANIEEIIKLLTSILKTTKQNINNLSN